MPSPTPFTTFGISILGAVLLGVIGLLFAWLSRRLGYQDKKQAEIHVLVNSRLSEALERIASLETALHLATGIPQDMIKKDLTPETPPVPPPAERRGV